MKKAKYRIGVIGTGFIARGLIFALADHPHLALSRVLTRRDPKTISNISIKQEQIISDVDEMIKNSDLVVECSGDVIHGTKAIEKVLVAGLPVVTMNSELQIITGTYLARKGTLIEAEGDQPGSLAALDAEIRGMGFEPMVYGNIKRFLNLNPLKDEMEYWSKRQGISLNQVTAFTDGTKVQIEQALVANGLGATIACRNLSGIPCKALEDGAYRLAEIADAINQPISDYVLSPIAPAGVFIVAKHAAEQKPYLEYLKLGQGPYYVILRPYHLCHLEIPKTIMNVLNGHNGYKFNNGQQPNIQVVAVAKRNVEKGEFIKRGLGSFDVRGEAVKIRNAPQGVPIGLLQEATLIKPVPEGQIISFADVELPKTRALEIWQQTLAEVK
ncbi:NAD(P)-dependent oxidoreductase [Patescibacteria group bacterium]|nr:MAG: NAD(P)-dependent oxidoreductase [Patescibacteria group bacterium]